MADRLRPRVSNATYSYSDRGRLKPTTLSQGTVTYLYNALNQRTVKTGPSALIATGASYLVYDEAGRLLGEYDANLLPIYETVYLGNAPVAVLKQQRTGSGSGATAQTLIYNVYTDHLSAPRVITNSDHAIVWRWDNAEVFGATQANEDPSGLGAFTFNQRFPGQIYDQEAGNSYNWHRDYKAQLGRYIQSDPIGLKGGINTYGYAGGNPASNYDSSGLDFRVNSRHDVIEISATVGIFGEDATPELAEKWEFGINAFWNRRGENLFHDGCRVEFNIKVAARPTVLEMYEFDNRIQVVRDPDSSFRSNITQRRPMIFFPWRGSTGQWSHNANGFTAAHEMGHIFGLSDDYTDTETIDGTVSTTDPGHEGHMMGDYPGEVHQHEIDEMLRGVRCDCGR